MKKVLVAMSGGVDSSVAAYLLQSAGYDVSGLTLKLFNTMNEDIIYSAALTAKAIGVPHYVLNLADDFKQRVMDYFVNSYLKGLTPNPCVECNRYIKFEEVLKFAASKDILKISTGHYAQIEYDNCSGRFLLKKAKESSKDQSYFLYVLNQRILKDTLFPLGTLTKEDVRKIAKEAGFENAGRKDSQDICFLPNGSYADFVMEYATSDIKDDGYFIDPKGKVLGRHKGIHQYTIGQRKGLGIALGKPAFVVSKNILNNTVTLADENALYSNRLRAGQINMISYESLEQPMRLKVKTRYSQSEQWARVFQVESDELVVEFESPQRAITAGQSAVFYEDEYVVGGGVII